MARVKTTDDADEHGGGAPTQLDRVATREYDENGYGTAAATGEIDPAAGDVFNR